jgi:hypothetical protein
MKIAIAARGWTDRQGPATSRDGASPGDARAPLPLVPHPNCGTPASASPRNAGACFDSRTFRSFHSGSAADAGGTCEQAPCLRSISERRPRRERPQSTYLHLMWKSVESAEVGVASMTYAPTVRPHFRTGSGDLVAHGEGSRERPSSSSRTSRSARASAAPAPTCALDGGSCSPIHGRQRRSSSTSASPSSWTISPRPTRGSGWAPSSFRRLSSRAARGT